MVATPYRRRKILFASAEGRTDRFWPIFFQNIPITHVTVPHVKSWGNFVLFSPLKQVFFSRGGANLSASLKMWAERWKCGQSSIYNDITIFTIICIEALLPTFSTLCPHFQRRHINQHWMKMTIDLDISLVSIAHIKTNMTVIASDEQSGGYVEELRN